MKIKTFIYSLVCPISNEVRYIGKSNNPKSRLYEHKKMRDNNIKKNLWIKSLLDKNLSPMLIILEEVDFIDWKDKEKFYISKYKNLNSNLLNICGGANGSSFGNKGSFDGSHSRRVISLNKDGTYNKEFSSVQEARSFYGSGLASVLSGKTKTAYGYIWLYKDKYDNLLEGELKSIVDNANKNMSNISWKNGLINYQFKRGQKSNKKKLVYQYTLDDIYIKEWESATDAAKTITGSIKGQKCICMCVNKKRKTAYGFKWSYKKL